MASIYKSFDRSTLQLAPLEDRVHDLHIAQLLPLEYHENSYPQLDSVAEKLIACRSEQKSSILIMGGHVVRAGVQRYLINLMENGLISCIAVNGACVIHDFEFSLIGSTTESVANYIKNGQFGFWKETSLLNDIIVDAADKNLGLGEAVGKYISEQSLPYSDVSLLSTAYRLKIPVTVHVGIGYDIIHQHPNCDGAATGKASYLDFLIFTETITNISGGIVMNFGSAVMGPEVFLKALSMARNRAVQEGKQIDDFTTLVCDLKELPANYHKEASKDNPLYYFRPWKTMLVRTPQAGSCIYVQGNHNRTIPSLWSSISKIENRHELDNDNK